MNKYYPIDYDPRRLPRQKGMGNIEDKIMVIRTMAPFHMRCKTCGNYIYRGTKFNSRVETVKGERYLGTIPIRRFYIRCTKCGTSITFKTDPENQDYAMETGATRNFEANRMWQLMEKREDEAIAEEERTNPMVALENRTAKSNQQMIMQENLEELYELAEKIGTGKGELTKQKALDIILDAKAKDAELLKMSLEDATLKIKEMQDEFRDEAARLGEDAEEEEDDAQVQVRDILKEMDPSALLTLNMDEDETPESDKRQKKLAEALDKTASKKKFAGLIRKSGTGEKTGATKKGMSFKQYQENLKIAEEKRKAEVERRKKAEESLKSSFAAYGSSSSDENSDEEKSEEIRENSDESQENSTSENTPENTDKTTGFKIPAIPQSPTPMASNNTPNPLESSNQVEKPDLPAGFIDPEMDDSSSPGKDDASPPKAGQKRKSSAEFGTNDFWSSITKKKSS